MEPSAPQSPPGDTRERLMTAAALVFAREGLEGATTRAIAREAGVNEVTLFRHFQTKENLQTAVMQRVFDQQAELLASQPPASPCDLRATLLRHARLYEALLNQNLPLVKTILGELQRHRDYEAQVIRGVFAPLKAELVTALAAARQSGIVREEIEPPIAADLFNAMIFTAVLRRGSPRPPEEYSHADYMKACVDVFARGIERAPASPGSPQQP